MEAFNQRIMNTQYPVCTLDLDAYMANTLVIVADHLIDMSHFCFTDSVQSVCEIYTFVCECGLEHQVRF